MSFLSEVRRYKGAWVDVEKPFWYDTPVWLASGMVDSIGIAHNHMQREGVYAGEAWGRPRDQERFPDPQGNGLWTQEIYYHVLNCGLRLPPSAGSASGGLPNPVGYDRLYVHLDSALSYERWWEGLRAGRVFVSNGPLLRCRANGQWPGPALSGAGGGWWESWGAGGFFFPRGPRRRGRANGKGRGFFLRAGGGETVNLKDMA